MWIVPKTLSHFAPVTEGLKLESSELAWMLEQSVTMRSKHSLKQTWLRRLKRGGFLVHLSGRILKPSQHQSFEEKFTASLGATLVSHFQALESEKEKTTQDTCGLTSENTSEQLDLFGASLKMSEVTPRWGYGESCPIWKKMVTKRSSDCSVRRKQARLTNASESSSLRNYPTPTSRDWKGKQANEYKDERGEENNMKFASLPGLVDKIAKKSWATPNTMDHLPPKTGEALARNKKKGGCKNLREDVNNPKNWATPQGRDHLSAEPKEKWEARAKLQAEKGVNLHLPLNTQCQHIMEEEARNNWPTATTNDATGSKYQYNQGDHSKKVMKLCGAVEQHAGPPTQEKSNMSGKNQGSWPTARSSDAEGGRIKTEKTEKGFRSKREKSDQYFGAKLRDAAEMEKPPTMKLNPNWVEQLMGLEVGWTQLPTEWIDSASSGMA